MFGSITIAVDDLDGGTVVCPSGKRVVSGGFFVDGNDVEVFLSEANDDRTGWVVAAARTTTTRLKPLSGRALRKVKAHAAKRGLTLTRR